MWVTHTLNCQNLSTMVSHFVSCFKGCNRKVSCINYRHDSSKLCNEYKFMCVYYYCCKACLLFKLQLLCFAIGMFRSFNLNCHLFCIDIAKEILRSAIHFKQLLLCSIDSIIILNSWTYHTLVFFGSRSIDS